MDKKPEIGEIIGVVRGDDGMMRYKIFNGCHQTVDNPVYFYTPVKSQQSK